MNRSSRLFRPLFWLLVFVLLTAPLWLIAELSRREQAQYTVPAPPVFVETAYGTIARAERGDVRESVCVSGVFQSFTYTYMELTQRDPSRIRWTIAVGDEIHAGQCIGSCQGEEILADCSGLVREIQAYSRENAYLRVQQAAPVVLVCDVSPGTLLALRYAKELTTPEGIAARLVYTAAIRGSDGSTRIHLQLDSEAYFLNQTVEELILYTGNAYPQALVLPKACLYQKTAGENDPWYVRRVTEDGVFLAELPVGRGYTDGELVCVTGVEEGQFFDEGYGQVLRGGDFT